jgi:uncharacterized protein (TIGR02271 family)
MGCPATEFRDFGITFRSLANSWEEVTVAVEGDRRQKRLAMTETIVAVFDTASAAEAAVRDIEAAGLPSAVIRRYTKDDPAVRDYKAEPAAQKPQSFWSWLFGEDELAPKYDYQIYDRSIAEGGTVVTVTVDDAQTARVMEILNRHGPIDLEERAAKYGVPGAPLAEKAGAQEEVIPLSEEQLQVGKRVVERGTTRLRRYVVQIPVEEAVTLREEQVTIERRRPVAPGTPGVPEGAFEERTVEVHATGEEPVVGKTARVAEEVVVRKDVSERAETVRDTVRREQVEVEKDGGPSADRSPSDKG